MSAKCQNRKTLLMFPWNQIVCPRLVLHDQPIESSHRLDGHAKAMTLSKSEKPIRHHIETREMKHWSKHWKVMPQEIGAAIEKVGNSVTAVQKELCLRGLIDKER
jgi:hypothetical protein